MIIIAIGSNLPHPVQGQPTQVCRSAVSTIAKCDCIILKQSRWYRSAAVPASSQPDFVNGVIGISSSLCPSDLMQKLHKIEAKYGRERAMPNAARVLDLDLVAYDNVVREEPEWPSLPHPRISQRAFVLYPLRDIMPVWRHPATGVELNDLISALPKDFNCVPIARPGVCRYGE